MDKTSKAELEFSKVDLRAMDSVISVSEGEDEEEADEDEGGSVVTQTSHQTQQTGNDLSGEGEHEAEAEEDEEAEEGTNDEFSETQDIIRDTLDPETIKRLNYEKRKKQRMQDQKSRVELEEEMEEEQEGISLLDRRDSELTPKEIVEKDILMYDLLMSNEELMEMHEMVDRQVQEVPEEEERLDEDGENEENETEEQDEDEEEEVEEVEEEEQEADKANDQFDIDDPDNIINLMMMAQEDEDDVELIFKSDFGTDIETEALAQQEGIIGVTLSDETKEFLEIEPDSAEWREKWVWLSHKKIMLHIYIYGEASEFFPYYDVIKKYPDFALLLGIDLQQQTGHPFFLCITMEARNFILNPPKKRKVYVDQKKKQEEAWDRLASIIPRKWKGLGSDAEVDSLIATSDRPPMTVYAYRFVEKFGKAYEFGDSKFVGESCRYTEFETKDPASVPTIERMEIDKGIQVNLPKVSTEAQTGFSFRRNKMTQHEVQEITPEEAEKYLTSPELLIFLDKVAHPMEKSLQQNEMLNIMADDYKNLKAKRGHDIEFTNESVLLQEYHTYSDLRHSRGRSVTFLMFHPLLDELVLMGLTEDVTFDKRIDLHSKTLMDPNFVIIWDLKEPARPVLMLDAPSDVFCAMVSPSDPNLICGGCANGQVVLWDLGRYYVEIRNQIQDRKRKESENIKKKGNFLEKLKDSAEKYVCPLIPPSGLSCLEVSHKRVVTCVHWLPPHVELGKNGNLYENSWGGRSGQFFSVAGDSSLRVWDIRVQKMGLDEFDQESSTTTTIKVTPWHHLENNSWKYTAKYNLDDGSGSMSCTIITLSEGRLNDRAIVEKLSTGLSASSTLGGDSGIVQGSGGSLASSKAKLRIGQGEKSVEFGEARRASTNSDVVSVHSGATKSDERRTIGSIASVGKPSVSLGTMGSRSTGVEFDSEIMNQLANRSGGTGGNVHAKTSFFAGCESGMVSLLDWMRNRDGSVNPDAAGNKNCQSIYTRMEHSGSITSVSRSPFHYDLLVVVGGGTISVWKEHSAHPIVSTLGEEAFAWCACWSPTRPTVFFVGTREGSVQVWDLMDKCHAPVLTQQVTPGRIVSIACPKAMTSKKHFLAAGDSQGNLFVMLIPRYYTRARPLEDSTITELMTREESRLNDWLKKTDDREEKMQLMHTEWTEKRVKKTEEQVIEKELSTEEKLVLEYQEFLEFESKLVGKLKREEPILPTDDNDIDAELEALVLQAEKLELEKLKLTQEHDEGEDDEKEAA